MRRPAVLKTRLEAAEKRPLSGRPPARRSLSSACPTLKGSGFTAPRRRWPVVLGSIAGLTVPALAFAGDTLQNTVLFIASHLIYPVIQLLGNLLISLINIMIAVAAYNDFTRAEAVTKGYTVIRDVSNMFFIVVLLIIAFGTILNIQSYKYNRLLGRLIIMAFLVNFAKLIAGFFIDIAQVVMLTFVNAFRLAAAGNLTTAFGIEDLLNLWNVPEVGVTGYTIVGALLLALALLIIAVIVIGVYVVVLLVRIIALWLLIVLSPLAYVLRTFPAGQKYASQWWENFSKYVICGPVIAFFLWLSLAVVASSTSVGGPNLSSQVLSGSKVLTEESSTSTASGGEVAVTISKISESDNLLSYIIAILLLLASMTSAQQLCGAAGKFVGQWQDRAKRAAMFATGITAAGVAIKKGQQGVQKTWELAKGGARAGLWALPARGLRRYQEWAPAWANPVAAVRGWREAREEKARRTRIRAVAKGRKWAEQVQTSMLGEIPLTPGWAKRLRQGPKVWGGTLNLPHEERVEAAEEKKFADEFGGMSKERKAAETWRLKDMGGEDGKRARRGMILTAATHGQLDDLMRSEQMQKYLDKKFGTEREWIDPETGETHTLTDEEYNYKRLNHFLYDYLGEDNQSLRLIEQIGDIGVKLGHPEYKGHSTNDETTGRPVSNSFGVGRGRKAVREAVTEWNKVTKTPAFGVHYHGVANIRRLPVVDPDSGEIIKDENGKDMYDDFAGVMDDVHRQTMSASFSGAPVGQIAQKGNTRTLMKLLTNKLVNKNGVLVGDKIDRARLAWALKHTPSFVKAALLQTHPELKGQFKFQAYERRENGSLDISAPVGDLIEEDTTKKDNEGREWEISPHGPYAKLDNEQVKLNTARALRHEYGLAAPVAGAPAAGAAPAGPAAPSGPAPTGAPLRDIAAEDQRRYEDMKRQVADWEGRYGQGSFWESEEYQGNPDNYLSRDYFSLLQRLERQQSAKISLGSFANEKNPSHALAFNGETLAGGKYRQLAGEYITDPKLLAEFAQDYLGAVNEQIAEQNAKPEAERDPQQLAELERAKQRLEAAIQNPGQLKQLRIQNFTAQGYSRRHGYAHEENHEKLDLIDPDRKLRGQMLAEQDAGEKGRILQWARRKFGDDSMQLEQAWNEWLAEGLTNAVTSRADQSPDAAQLDPSMIRRLNKQGKGKGKVDENGVAGDVLFRASTNWEQEQLGKVGRDTGKYGAAGKAVGVAVAGAALARLQAGGEALGTVARGAKGVLARGGGFLAGKLGAGVGQVEKTETGKRVTGALRTAGAGVSGLAKKVGGITVGAYQRLNPTEEQRLKKMRVESETAQEQVRGNLELLNEKRLFRKRLKDEDVVTRRRSAKRDAELSADVQRLEAERQAAAGKGDLKIVGAKSQEIAAKKDQQRKLREQNTQIAGKVAAADKEISELEQRVRTSMGEAEAKRKVADQASVGLTPHDHARLEVEARSQSLDQAKQRATDLDQPLRTYEARAAKRYAQIHTIDRELEGEHRKSGTLSADRKKYLETERQSLLDSEREESEDIAKWREQSKPEREAAARTAAFAAQRLEDAQKAYEPLGWQTRQAAAAPPPAPTAKPAPPPPSPQPSSQPAVASEPAPAEITRETVGPTGQVTADASALKTMFDGLQQTMLGLRDDLTGLTGGLAQLRQHLGEGGPSTRAAGKAGAGKATDELSGKVDRLRQLVGEAQSRPFNEAERREWMEKFKRAYEDALHQWKQGAGAVAASAASRQPSGSAQKASPASPPKPKPTTPPPPQPPPPLAQP